MDLQEARGAVDFGIITVRPDEFTAVLDRLPARDTIAGGKRFYEFSPLPTATGAVRGVAVVRSLEQGQGAAQAVARDLIDDVDPRWLLLVGIAGGVPDDEFSLGDVLLASRLHDFAVAAALQDHTQQWNLGGGPVHKDVEALLAHIPAWEAKFVGWNTPESIGRAKPVLQPRDDPGAEGYYGPPAWREKVRTSLCRHFPKAGPIRPPRYWVAPAASSNTLIKDAELLAQWQQAARALAHVEMELGGVYLAARQRHREYPVLAIRGLSDIVGYRRSGAWTEYACHAAAAFAHAFIRSGVIDPRAGGEPLARRPSPGKRRRKLRSPETPPGPKTVDRALAATPTPPPSLDHLFSRDPSVSIPTAKRFIAAGPAALPLVVGRLMRPESRLEDYGARMVLAAFPQEAAPLLADRVLRADKDWDGAVVAAGCLDVAHAPFCADRLGKTMRSATEPDVVRVCMEALGHLGAAGWAFPILETLRADFGSTLGGYDHYRYDKYAHYGVEALARIFVRMAPTPSLMLNAHLRSAFDTLMRGIKTLLEREPRHNLPEVDILKALSLCRPRHADVLIEQGLPSAEVVTRMAAVRALGQMGLSRALPLLVERLRGIADDPEVAREAALALGNIGGPEAILALSEALDIPGLDLGLYEFGGACLVSLAFCLDGVQDGSRFEGLCGRLLDSPLEEKCWVYRAMGLRKEPKHVAILKEALRSPERSERGHAALALARVCGRTEIESLQAAYHEASYPLDRILTGLALVQVGRRGEVVKLLAQLRTDLAVESYLYKRLTREDIVSVLRACREPVAALLADCWASVYVESLNY